MKTHGANIASLAMFYMLQKKGFVLNGRWAYVYVVPPQFLLPPVCL